ncbi:MAG: hypothetical protein EOO77_36410, partial [Oxalobacteraceae bacterium]
MSGPMDDDTSPKRLKGVGPYWRHTYLAVYNAMVKQAFRDTKQLSVAFDPSTYDGEETLVAIAYSPIHKVAAHLPLQILRRGGLAAAELPSATPQHIARFGQRVDRLAAHRQLAGLHHALQTVLTEGLSAFHVPVDALVRAPLPHETRIVVNNIAYLAHPVCDAEGGRDSTEGGRGGLSPILASDGGLPSVETSRHDAFAKPASRVVAGVRYTQELPDDIARIWPSLVTATDQGSVGMAGVAFAQARAPGLRLLWLAVGDPYHRGPNDVRGACKQALRGQLRRAMLQTTVLWNLNYKPFGTGAWFHEKQALLASFLETESWQSPLFQRFAPLLAECWDMPSDSNEDHQRLFDSLGSHLQSFQKKGPLVKGSR